VRKPRRPRAARASRLPRQATSLQKSMARMIKLALLQAAGLASVVDAGGAALLLIDVQDCFLEANTTSGQPGSLSVPASQIIPVINKIRAEKECMFDVVVRTQDYHPTNHISFGSTHGLAAFSHLAGKGGLPITCIKPTSGNTADASCCPTQYVNSSAVNCSAQLCPSNWTWADFQSGLHAVRERPCLLLQR